MKNYTNIALVASFFGLWMDSYFSNHIQIILGFLLIFSFGILHGANDLLLIKNLNKKNINKSWLKILGYYVFVVLIGILLFVILPQFALLLFIIISSYHFGEQEWQQLGIEFSKMLIITFQFSYGLLILLLLFNFHTIQTQDIIFKITTFSVPYYIFSLALKIVAPLYIVMSGFIFYKAEKLRKKIVFELFFMLLFAILFNSSSLIWGFAIYFVLWHSIPSIIDQIKFLNGSFSVNNFIMYCRNAGIYWLISIIGIAGIYFLFREEELFNAVFFSFLAAITFPHTFVINKMFSGKELNHS
jgi:Brp/Blh family beta-carotene 15,15'-monooxygenase